MYKLISWYNQNRKKFWVVIIAIIFIIVIIQLLNFLSKIDLENETERINQEANSNVKTYDKQSESIISGGSVNENYQSQYGSLLDDFLSNCISGNYEVSYELLSQECKDELYPSLKSFEIDYCEEKFDNNKQYDFQSWISDKANIYQIRIYDNILQSGNANINYIEDYYTIVRENGENKINIAGFINGEDFRNKQGNYEGVNISINSLKTYMEYKVVEITVSNDTDKTIMLDSKTTMNDTYIVDNNENKTYALLNENLDEDLIISAHSRKNITIRFPESYQSELGTVKICFSRIVLDYDLLQNNQDFDYGSVEILF